MNNNNNFLKITGIFAYLLVIIGALNWGLVGILKFDIVEFLFGYMSKLSRIIYTFIGLSALVAIITTSSCITKNEIK